MSLPISKRTTILPLTFGVKFSVARYTHQLKVLYPIVCLVTVNVVDVLFGPKFPSKVLFHNISVFKNTFTATDPDHNVALNSLRLARLPHRMTAKSVPNANRLVVTSPRTILSLIISGLKAHFTYKTIYGGEVTSSHTRSIP